MHACRLYRRERLKRRADILKFFGKSVRPLRFVGRYFTLLVFVNDLTYSRFAVATKRKFGNAVKRNRARRLVREIFRNNKTFVPLGFDFFILVAGACQLNYVSLEEDLIALFRKVVK